MSSSTKIPPPPPSQILAKANYDMATHGAESTGWMNVLFAQVSWGIRRGFGCRRPGWLYADMQRSCRDIGMISYQLEEKKEPEQR